MRKKQVEFVEALGLLIAYAYYQGYELTLGEGFVLPCPQCHWYGHKKDGYHPRKLAIDLNLFIDGVYQEDTESHRKLGEFWESLGGTWGGRWNDGNHYSWGE